MVKIIAFNRKERFMESVLNCVKFVVDCILATLVTVIMSLSYINDFINIWIKKAVNRLSPDVANMMYDTMEITQCKAVMIFRLICK